MKFKFILMVLLFFGFAVSQEVLLYNTNHLFKNSETILTDANGKYYFEMVDVDTATSAEITIRGGRNGDVRVSIWAHNVSGTLNLELQVGMKVADFGADSLDYSWISVTTIGSIDDQVTKTFLMTDFPEWVAPIIAYKVRVITSGIQQTQVKVNVLQYKR